MNVSRKIHPHTELIKLCIAAEPPSGTMMSMAAVTQITQKTAGSFQTDKSQLRLKERIMAWYSMGCVGFKVLRVFQYIACQRCSGRGGYQLCIPVVGTL